MTTVCFALSYLGAFILGFVICFVISIILALRSEEKKNSHIDRKLSDRNTCGRKAIHENAIFATRKDAEEILCKMLEYIEIYGRVSKADFCEISGLTSTYEDDKVGWTNLYGARVERTKNGYRIRVPKLIEL